MFRMEKLNVVRYAANDKKKAKLKEQGFKEVPEEDLTKQKRGTVNGRDKG